MFLISNENRTFNTGITESFRKTQTAAGPSPLKHLSINVINPIYIHLKSFLTVGSPGVYTNHPGILRSQITAAGSVFDQAMSDSPSSPSPSLFCIPAWMTALFHTPLLFIREDKYVFVCLLSLNLFHSVFISPARSDK